MNSRESNNNIKIIEGLEEDFKESYASQKRNGKKRSSPSISKNVLLAVGLITLSLVAGTFILGPSYDRDPKPVTPPEARLKQLEDRVLRIEGIVLGKVDGSGKRGLAQGSKKEKKFRYHVIRYGESLSTISRRYGLTVEELRRLNNLAPGKTIYAGDKLIVEER